MTLQICDDHIHAELLRLSQTAAVDSVAFLSQILIVWKDHFNQMLLIRSVFLYLDRLYVGKGQQELSLFDMGLSLFRQHLDSLPEVIPVPPYAQDIKNHVSLCEEYGIEKIKRTRLSSFRTCKPLSHRYPCKQENVNYCGQHSKPVLPSFMARMTHKVVHPCSL